MMAYSLQLSWSVWRKQSPDKAASFSLTWILEEIDSTWRTKPSRDLMYTFTAKFIVFIHWKMNAMLTCKIMILKQFLNTNFQNLTKQIMTLKGLINSVRYESTWMWFQHWSNPVLSLHKSYNSAIKPSSPLLHSGLLRALWWVLRRYVLWLLLASFLRILALYWQHDKYKLKYIRNKFYLGLNLKNIGTFSYGWSFPWLGNTVTIDATSFGSPWPG